MGVFQNLSVFIGRPHQYQLEEGYLGSGPGLGKRRKISVFQVNRGQHSARNGSALAKLLPPVGFILELGVAARKTLL